MGDLVVGPGHAADRAGQPGGVPRRVREDESAEHHVGASRDVETAASGDLGAGDGLRGDHDGIGLRPGALDLERRFRRVGPVRDQDPVAGQGGLHPAHQVGPRGDAQGPLGGWKAVEAVRSRSGPGRAGPTGECDRQDRRRCRSLPHRSSCFRAEYNVVARARPASAYNGPTVRVLHLTDRQTARGGAHRHREGVIERPSSAGTAFTWWPATIRVRPRCAPRRSSRSWRPARRRRRRSTPSSRGSGRTSSTCIPS